MNKTIKILRSIFCILLCLGLTFSTAACKKQNVQSELSDEYEIVYEYLEESSISESEENGQNTTSSQNSANNTNSSKSETVSTESQKNNSQTNNNDISSVSSEPKKDKIYKTTDELFEDDPPLDSIVTLDIEPYAKGKYKIVSGSYISNDSSIVYVSSGKFAIRYTEELNAWQKAVPSGSFIAHQGFNGWIDKTYLGGGETSNGTYPSNTKEAAEHAVRLGYKFIELDITTTKDGVWVVSHDANSKELLTDLNKESLPFTAMLSAVVSKMKIQRKWKGGGYWEFSDKIQKESVPTLETVFKYMQNNDAYIILDNKSLSHHAFTDKEYDTLADLINKYNMGNRCAAYAECLKPLTDRIHGLIACYSSLPSHDEQSAYNIMSSYGNFMLSVSIGEYTDYLAFAKKYNVPLAVWVVDDYKTADTVFSNGADYVLTNYCLPKNANFKDYQTIKSFSLSDFAAENRTSGATASYTDSNVIVTSADQGAAQLSLGFSELGLKTGDIITLSAECAVNSGEAFIKICTDGSSTLLEATRTITDKNTVYYIVNDDNGASLCANLEVKNGSAAFSGVKISIMRETARGEK